MILRRKIKDNCGSVMLETALILPLLLVIILGLLQFAFLFTAVQMTRYAAYCAARAALVYHPVEQADRARDAASMVLSWIAFSFDADKSAWKLGDGTVPASNGIRDRIFVSVQDDTAGDPRGKTIPAVTANVTFHFNLFIPYANVIIGAIFAAIDSGETDLPDGLIPWASSESSKSSMNYDKYATHGIYQVPLKATFVIPKPYSTESFPLTGK